MVSEPIEVLMVEAGYRPCKVSIGSNYESLQTLVSPCFTLLSDVEFIILEDDVAIFHNREGVLLGLKGNRRVDDIIIAGTFFVVGVKDRKITSLSKEKQAKYRKRFWKIENYTDKEVSEAYWNAWLDTAHDYSLDFV